MRPHDLLLLVDGADLCCEEPVPTWVPAALARAPWVVVRRDFSLNDLIPVGARGHARADRFAAFLDPAAVAARATPENLASARGWRCSPRARSVGALRSLDAADELFTSRGLIWGPTGSVGFELATGVPTAGPTSDLDVLIRAPEPWPLERARELVESLARLPTRVDVQLDTPAGVVALVEYVRGSVVLLRTPDGPRLVRDPWRRPATDLETA